MIKRLGVATDMCYTILESPEQASNMQNRRIFIFVRQLEFSMFQTFDFRCVETLATAAPGCRGGVYVINVTYSRKLRSVVPPFFYHALYCKLFIQRLGIDVGFAGKGIRQVGKCFKDEAGLG